jgi:hypothetical protein
MTVDQPLNNLGRGYYDQQFGDAVQRIRKPSLARYTSGNGPSPAKKVPVVLIYLAIGCMIVLLRVSNRTSSHYSPPPTRIVLPPVNQNLGMPQFQHWPRRDFDQEKQPLKKEVIEDILKKLRKQGEEQIPRIPAVPRPEGEKKPAGIIDL